MDKNLRDPEEGVIFEKSVAGRTAADLGPDPWEDRPDPELPAALERGPELQLPEVSHLQVTRHYVRLSQNNFAIDYGFYPLGSCSMKYNPKLNEEVAADPGFTNLHPLQPDEQPQGALEVMHTLKGWLEEISGTDEISLQPAAGAQGELTCLLIFKQYFRDIGEAQREVILVPDSAHGTNPASAVMAGFEVEDFRTGDEGYVEPDVLRESIDEIGAERLAGIMLTNPSTLGLFEKHIDEIASVIHQAGGLLYYDGANLNALMGISRPGDMGFDAVHINTHKTFSTPHGGGGPGAGPVGVRGDLVDYLPSPGVRENSDGDYELFDYDKSIGRMKAFQGNFGVLLRAWSYILANGEQGLREISRNAILNANYLKNRISDHYEVPFDQHCMHEFVASAKRQKDQGVKAMEIAKRLLEYDVHAPTVYFPLIVDEAMMIEPTETEAKETLDYFADLLNGFAEQIADDPEKFHDYESKLEYQGVDEAEAARNPVPRWHPDG